MNKCLFIVISFYFISNANCQTVDFTFETSNGVFCNPSTVIFKQKCTGNPKGFIWSFGNNLYSDKPIDSTSYTSAGSYTVKLIAVYEKTGIEISKTIVINPGVTAGIGYDKNNLCQPGIINFTGFGSGNIKNYEWNFGDGTALVNTSSGAISHSFANYGRDSVILKVTSNSGCSNSSSTIVTIKKFDIKGTVSPTRGCVPAIANFTGDVTLPGNASVASYIWDFGDGSPKFVSTVNAATHTYTQVGSYLPTLTAITNEGCSNTYQYSLLRFGVPPNNHVALAQTNPVCGSDSVVFITKATNAQRYYWGFGDGTTASSTDTVIKHKYNTIGNKNVYVNAYNNECESPSVNFKVSIIGVIAKYSYANTCSNKNTYSFSDTSSGVPTSRLWSYGDGFQQLSSANTVHSFPTSGQFRTTLYLTDTVSGCSDSISKQIYTAIPDLYSADSSICINTGASFSILNNYTDTAARYTWNVLGQQIDTVRNSAITIGADSLGRFNNFVVINYGKESCPDTVNLKNSILVRGPNLNFTAPTGICLNTALQVINLSQPFITDDSIKTWHWNFGNSTTSYSVFQPAPYLYTREGTYPVSLAAIDKNGCTDTLTKTIIINPTPYLHIMPSKYVLCYGQSVTMNAYHNNDVLWSPAGSLSCATCDTTIATPLASTKYYITASNSFNCSVQDSNYIEVVMPYTATITPGDVYICQKQGTTVDVNPKGKKILWSPTTGLSNPTIYNPVISPMQNTIYTVSLTDSLGCLTSSNASVNVYVKSLPIVDAGPDKFYIKGTSFTFAPTYGNNVVSYLWSPSGSLDCNTCAIPNGVADSTRKYILKVTSDSGCVATDSVTIAIECKSSNIFVPSAFSPNNDNLNDYFYPMAKGIKAILKFSIYNRQGQVIYEASNFSPNDKLYGWNGKFRGAEQPNGTYVYTLEAVCEIGEKLVKNGSFLLLR